jgi:hypothetical protein
MLMPTARGSLLSSNLFPADNPWNQNISQAPVATNSAAIINSIIAKCGNGRFHPDFGQDYQLAGNPLYGIPYNVVPGNSTAKIQVVIDAYPDESDLQNAPIAQRARTAFRALRVRCSGVRPLARAFPPLSPPSLPRRWTGRGQTVDGNSS